MRGPATLRELLAHPAVDEHSELGGRFGVMAYHGGNLERSTDAIASEVAKATGASLYSVRQRAPLRTHLPSTAFDPDHSERLAEFLDHVDVVVTVHGYGRRRLRNCVLLGGRNRSLAGHMASHLRDRLPARYRVLDDVEAIPNELRGLHARNPVNRPAEAGVQIELPVSVRWNWREWGWSDHAGIGRTEAVQAVIDGLASAIAAWPASDSPDAPQSTRSRDATRPLYAPVARVEDR